MNNFVELSEQEINHLNSLGTLASECTLFLKRNDDFPIDVVELKEIGLYGNGARHTVKGGTGSGDVDIHVFNTVEDIFKQINVKITSTKWLDKYDKARKHRFASYKRSVIKEAHLYKATVGGYALGAVMPEFEYNFKKCLNKDKVAIYVLSRRCGEGRDRKVIKGDFLLTDTEVREIKWLSENCEKFILVINSASPIDLTPVIAQCKNILLLSQLGSLTSETLFSILTGETYPSGKLSSTWDKYENYPNSDNFGELDETKYQEGLFIGYKYFESKEMKPLFPFGFGLSYTDFDIKFQKIEHDKDLFKVSAVVKNIGDHNGKEVVQLYLSKPSYMDLPSPRIQLISYAKTSELEPEGEETVILKFKLSDFPSFEPELDAYNLMKGIYFISLGNASNNLKIVASINLKEEIILKKVKHIDEPIEYKDKLKGFGSAYVKQQINIDLSIQDFEPTIEVNYSKYSEKPNDVIEKLKNNELTQLSMGNLNKSIRAKISDPALNVLGAAGETTQNIPSIDKHLVLADGPAGLRLAKECIQLENGKRLRVSEDPIWTSIKPYVPKIFNCMVATKHNANKLGDSYYQYTTAIPVASAIASSFSDAVAYKCAKIVEEEMETYNVDVWLAPALNLIRNPLCGRNFEYFSEDNYLTARTALNIVNGIQEGTNKKVCVKHFACNNQEFNRFNNNSILSVRTLRELYLSQFDYVIKYGNPFAVMTSYNLINGEHASESYTLVNDILRNEMNFKGLVMSDWIVTGDKLIKVSKNPGIRASKEIKAGVNLVMPGNKKDVKDITLALKNNELSKDELMNNCNIVYNHISEIKDMEVEQEAEYID